MKKILIISGATATGKTDLSLAIAKKINGVIVNFDSLLLYQELNIGTAKPSEKERKDIPHFMIDVVSIANPMNAASFEKMCSPIVENLLQEKRPIILVGGSGFYLQALIKGMYPSPTTPKEIIERSNALYAKEGIKPFLEILEVEDSVSYKRYHQNDHYRIRRAVEHWWSNHNQFSSAKNEHETKSTSKDWEMLHCYLDIPKESHWKIIQSRTQKMIDNGLIDEVSNLLKNGFTGKEKPLQSIGYKESIDFLNRKLTLEECTEKISISTRQLAKSQRTWFNRIDKLSSNPLMDQAHLIELSEEFFKRLG